MTRNRDIYGDDTDYERKYEAASGKLCSAVALINAIAGDEKADPSCACDVWLEKNGYESATMRRVRERKQREQRAEQLGAEIAKLQQERTRLRDS